MTCEQPAKELCTAWVSRTMDGPKTMCTLPQGHEGAHENADNAIKWAQLRVSW